MIFSWFSQTGDKLDRQIEEAKKELKKQQEISSRNALVKREAAEKALVEKRKKLVKTRGLYDDFIHFTIESPNPSEVKIKYYFSSAQDMYSLLVYRSRNSLPHDHEEAKKMVQNGTASLIEKRVIYEGKIDSITSNEDDPRLNGRLTGEVVDRPVYEGKEMFFYCVMLEDPQGRGIAFDGKQFILRQYSAIKHEEFKQGKLIAKAKTKQIKEELLPREKNNDSLLSQFEKQVQEIFEDETSKTEILNKSEQIKEQINSDNNISDEDKEEKISLVSELAVKFITK